MEGIPLIRYLLVLALLAAGLRANGLPLSATAAASADSGPLAPTQNADGAVEDADASPSAAAVSAPDLGGVSTAVLAKLSANLSADRDAVYYEAEQDLPLQEPAAGAWKVDAVALYDELAHRLVFAEDKGARQALSLAILGGDERASAAKRLAYAAKGDAGAATPAALSPAAMAGLTATAGLTVTTSTSTTAQTGDKP
jgi:hypothetical protein